ncbi:MAG: hypothetical protein HYY23_07965 [Verrucomicrobia bacterium]|nr:hypothetical protein [Verrucomicrobiota bacterium]
MKSSRSMRMWFASFMVWIGIVGAFSVFGYLMGARAPESWTASGKRLFALREVLSWGGLGTGIATCASAALLIRAGVKSGHLARHWAIVTYGIVCVASTALPMLVMSFPKAVGGRDVFAGESGWAVLGVISVMLIVAVIAFVVFIPCVFAAWSRETEPSGSSQ